MIFSNSIHLDGAASNIQCFLGEMCFFNSAEGLPGANRAYLHLETRKLQEVFNSKTNSILTGNNVLDGLVSNTDGKFLVDTCVFSP
jgi:hypothetical protein